MNQACHCGCQVSALFAWWLALGMEVGTVGSLSLQAGQLVSVRRVTGLLRQAGLARRLVVGNLRPLCQHACALVSLHVLPADQLLCGVHHESCV